ncbi:helix-turn-helix domain-containing protein [Bradyrhizobium sp. BR 1433]|uniref:helix-turn-helix domain-containing protein n=1 Tax=Bradyrhizobium sp. BR 1433 TaxID=3447967 RepID=UPI003EE70C14
MAKVNPVILQTLRRRKGWSQDRLAEMAKVNKQTISRIERGDQETTRGNTTKQLARALGVEPAELMLETLAREANETEPMKRRSPSAFGVSTAANNFLHLISDRYFIKPWQVMELAPLLFCWAAETSLRERRERLNKLEEACETARRLEGEMLHMPPPNFIHSEEKISAESNSIGNHDVFGMCFSDDDFGTDHLHSDDDTDNPFAIFLAKLVREIGDMAKFEGFSPIDYPVFQVCREEAREMVSGDETLAELILAGVIDLNEMPSDVRGTFGVVDTEKCAAWARTQADAFIKRQTEANDISKEMTP